MTTQAKLAHTPSVFSDADYMKLLYDNAALVAQVETLRGALKESIGAMNSADQILAVHSVLPSNATRRWVRDACNIGEAALAATAKVPATATGSAGR